MIKLRTIRNFFLSLLFIFSTNISHCYAVGIGTGPSVGIAGNYTSFDSKEGLKKPVVGNFAFQGGWFVSVNFLLFYIKLEPFFVVDWRHLPQDNINANYYSFWFNHLSLPFTGGVSLFNVLRPHFGVLFRIPLSEEAALVKKSALYQRWKKAFNSYIWGIGIDIGKLSLDFDFEIGTSSVKKDQIQVSLLDNNHKLYTPKQFSLKVNYNLIGS